MMVLKVFSLMERLSLSEYREKPLYLLIQEILRLLGLLMVDDKLLSLVDGCIEE